MSVKDKVIDLLSGALHMAATGGHTEIIKYLQSKGCDVSVKDKVIDLLSGDVGNIFDDHKAEENMNHQFQSKRILTICHVYLLTNNNVWSNSGYNLCYIESLYLKLDLQ